MASAYNRAVIELEQRDRLLVEIANRFHKGLMFHLSHDIGGSLADMVEDELVDVLNGYVFQGRIKWQGLGRGYGLEEDE